MIKLSLLYNAGIEEMASCESAKLTKASNVTVEFSDAFAIADVSAVRCLNAVDAWHPSDFGHNVLASAAHKEVKAAVESIRVACLNVEEGRQSSL